MSTKTIKSGLSKANVNAIAGAIGTATLNRLVPQFSTSVAYTKGQYTNYNNQLYRFTADKSAGAWDSSKVESASLNDLINDVNNAVASVTGKANVDGNYPTMTVGNADQLNSTVYVVDKVPYLYRTSGGDADIGNREYDKIIGGSLVVNQKFNPPETKTDRGVTENYDASTGVVTLSGTSTGTYTSLFHSTPIVLNHKYLLVLSNLINPNNLSFKIGTLNGGVEIWSTNLTGIAVSNTTTEYGQLGLESFGGVGVSFDGISFRFNFIDLTQMLGSTIADYIYALEQANAGAGVAWFRNYFKEEYYPYNDGAIKNVKLVSHDMVGFNQWDEEWENGSYDAATGEKITNPLKIRNKNLIRVIPDTTYYFKSPVGLNLFFYNSNKELIGVDLTNMTGNKQYLIPSNCYYIGFSTFGTGTTTYNNDICINLSWSGWRNGQYEPYQKNSYPLDTTIELRGIPKLDSDNHLYFDGDEYSSDGKVVRKDKGLILDGSSDEIWTLQSINSNGIANFSIHIDDFKDFDNSLCNRFALQTSLISQTTDEGYYLGGNFDTLFIRIKSSTASTVEGFRTWLSNNIVEVVYELATPTEETADTFQEPQIVDDFGTEEYVVPTQDGWQIPVGHDTKYPANLRDKLQRLPDMPSVSQNVTETYVVNYNGTTKKCTFVDIDTWLGSNGYKKASELPTNDAVGGTLRQCLCVKESLDFDNTLVVNWGDVSISTQNSANGVFYCTPLNAKSGAKCLTTKYKSVTSPAYATINDKECGFNGTVLIFRDTDFANKTSDEVQLLLKGVLLAYEKA